MPVPALSIVDFLESLNLAHLAATFEAEDVDLSVLPLLKPDDLVELGLTLGQRKKLTAALSVLEAADGKVAAERNEDEIQLRRLSVMFCDIVGSTDLGERLSIDGMQQLLSHYYSIARRIADDHDGHIATVQGDGVVMLFGFPRVSEGTASRCVKAALDFQKTLAVSPARISSRQSIPIRTRIGIATGKAAVGLPDGRTPGGATHLVGPVVNRAARLQTLAKELSILADDRTREQTKEHFAFASPTMERLKGVQQEVAVSQVLGRSHHREDSSTEVQQLLGRDAEFGNLISLLSHVQSGAPAFAKVTGDAGIGKTALVQSFLAAPETQSIQVMRLRCSPLAEQTALWPIADYLDTESKSTDDSYRIRKSDELRHLLAHSDPDLCRSAVDYLGLGEPDGETAHRPSEGDRDAVLLLLANWLCGESDQPTLLWLENAHWSDHTTLQLMEMCAASLMRHPKPVLMVTTGRELHDSALTDARPLEEIPLEPLDADASEALLDRIVGGRTLPISVGQRILRNSGGNPLMLEALGRSHGILESSDLASEVDVPFTIYESVSKRLDEIPAGRGAIEALAVINGPADCKTLSLVMGVPGSDLTAPLAALEKAGLVVRAEVPRGDLFRIRHQAYRDVIYERVTGASRRKIHSAAYRALKDLVPGIETERPDILAMHASGAQNYAVAVTHALDAGDRLLRQSALIEASHFFRTAKDALEVQPESDKRNRLTLKAISGLASIERSRFGIATDESGRLGQQSLQIARRLGDKRAELLSLNGLYAHSVVRADYRLAEEFATELLETARQFQDDTFEMIGIRARGAVSLHTGDLIAAQERLQLALERYDKDRHLHLAHSFGYDHAEICSAFLAFVHWIRGDPVAARKMSDFSVGHSREIDHAHSLGQAMAFRVMLGALARDTSGLAAIGHEAVELGDKYDLRVMRMAGHLYPFASRLCTQPDTPSQQDIDQLTERVSAFQLVNPYNYGPLTLSLVADAAMRVGMIDAAEQTLNTARDLELHSAETWTSPELDRLRARLLEQSGKAAEADRMREHALETSNKVDAVMFALRIACDMVEARPGTETRALLRSTLNRIKSDDDAWDLRRAKSLLSSAR